MPDNKISPDVEIKDSFTISYINRNTYYDEVLVSVTYNRLFVIEQGEGKIIVDSKELSLNDKEAVIVSKGQVFSFASDTTFTGFEIKFGDCFWEKAPKSASNCKCLLFNDATLHQKIPLNDNTISVLNSVCEMLLQEYHAEDYPNKLDSMAAYLKILMIKLANTVPEFQQGIDDFDNKIYRRFLELVNVHYNQMHDVTYYADALSVTPRKLYEITKRKCGKGAKEIIAGQVVAESKRQLQFSAKTIKEIAFELSFGTPEQFSHFFKKHAGTPPLDYRRTFLNIGK